MARISFLQLTAVGLISSTVPTTTAHAAAIDAAQAIGLLPRAQQCVDSTYKACGDGLPGNFCCPSGQTCYTFNNVKSAICCPSGKDCTTISSISCDLSQQNANVHPQSPLFTTDLSTQLTKCGDKCCPNGMTCNNGQCTLSSSSSSSSPASSSSSAATATTSDPGSSASAAATSTTNGASAATTSVPTSNTPSNTPSKPASSQSTAAAAASAHCNQFAAPGVLVGFFTGLAVGIICTILIIICFGHRHRNNSKDRASSDFGSIAATVSDPIYRNDANAYRSEFLRRESKKHSSTHSSTRRIRSLLSRSPTIRTRSSPVDGIGRSIPRTPSMKREPSMESIKIYSPENVRDDVRRPNTTFTDMMSEAGFKPGEPYVPQTAGYIGSPGRVDPRARGLGV